MLQLMVTILATLHSQNSAYGGPICMKQKALVFTLPDLNRHVNIFKVTQVGHFENLTLLYPSGAIGHQALHQLILVQFKNTLLLKYFSKQTRWCKVWCHR